MGCASSSSPSARVAPEEKSPLVKLLDSHGRCWGGPAAGIFFEHDPAPAIVAHCESLGTEFEDPDFDVRGSLPHSLAAHTSPLANLTALSDSHGKVFFDGSVSGGAWLRHRDIPRTEGKELQLIDRLSVTDVIQGGIGNCWLCAVVCAAINYAPDVVASAISPPAPNAAGCYSVRLWVEGAPLYIPVDDRIYCTDGGVPFDMHSNQAHEMYVSLIAKAMAKWLFWYDLNGDERDNNRTIDEGMVLYCLRALTGSGDDFGKDIKWENAVPKRSMFRKAASTPIDVVPAASAAMSVRAILERGCAATCSGAAEKNGLIDTHAYTVLWYGVAAGVELVQLRNPHGGGGSARDWEEGEWQGAWSDKDQLWDERPDVKAALESLRNDGARSPYWDKQVSHDGIFFMSFEDFLTHFQYIQYAAPPFGGLVQEHQAAFEAAHQGQPSGRWRIRPAARGITRWDVSNLRFFSAQGAELQPASAIESASAADAQYDNNPGWDAKGMLFGGDGFTREQGCWGGRCPDNDPLGPWVGAVFEPPVAVASVHFKQDDFTEVVLEQYVTDSDKWLKAQLLNVKLEAAY